MTAFDQIRQAVIEELELRRAEIEQRQTRSFSIKMFLADDGISPVQITFQSERRKHLTGKQRDWSGA